MAEYTKVFENPYPNGWEDLPSENTPITANALQEHTDAIENIEQYLEDNPIGQGGADVQWNQIQPDGTKIAEITIDGETTDVFAPNGGGSGADFIELTKAEYDALPDTKLTDGVPRLITDYSESGGSSQEIYDDTERVIGTWFGKPLYRKVMAITSSVTFNNIGDYLTIPCGDIPNIDVLVNAGIESNKRYITGWIGKDASGVLKFMNFRNGMWILSNGNVIIEYTKVGD